MNFERVMVIGSPGSGKTTFSARFAGLLNREVVHLDKVLWLPNWHMPEYEERKKIQDELIAQQNWIIDGMWKSHVADRIKRATTVILLDYKRTLCMHRAIWRFFKNGKKQRFDMAENCFEKLDKEFLQYIWNFPKDTRPYLLSLLDVYKDQTDIVILKNPKQARQFLERLAKQKTQG